MGLLFLLFSAPWLTAVEFRASRIMELHDPYDVVFEWTSPPKNHKHLVEIMKKVTDTYLSRKTPPATLALLKMRMKGDEKRLKDVMVSEGYYEATVRSETQVLSNKQIKATFTIDPDILYVYGPMVVHVNEGATGGVSSVSTPSRRTLELIQGEPALAEKVKAAQKTILKSVHAQGYVQAKYARIKFLAFHDLDQLGMYFDIISGPRMRYGTTQVHGLKQVHTNYVERRIPWTEGEYYDPDTVKDFRQKLISSGLFTEVVLLASNKTDQADVLDLTLNLAEDKTRMISLGLGYNTEKGPGVMASWGNKNMSGKGDRLSFMTLISDSETRGSLSYILPDTPMLDQELSARLVLGNDNPRAYASRYSIAAMGLSQKLSTYVNAGSSAGLKADKVTKNKQTDNYLFWYVPTFCKWDWRDNPADPAWGGVVNAMVTPFYEINENVVFVSEEINYAHFYKLWKDPLVVIRGTVGIGSIQGANYQYIPADERFYAGGASSVRGYEYQMAGPLEDGEPTGGQSQFLCGLELQWRVWKQLGLVGFVDGGSVFPGEIPPGQDRLYWGYGTGVRYMTPIGAVGVDVGFPVDRRDVDAAYQIYISIDFNY